MPKFSDVYKINQEFDTNEQAIEFANANNWKNEITYDKILAVPVCTHIGTSDDNSIDIWFDFDMHNYFFRKKTKNMKIIKYKIVDTFFNGTDSNLIEPTDINGFNIFPVDGFNSEQEAEDALFEHFRKIAEEEEYQKCGLVINPTYTIIKRYGWNPAE